MAAAPTSVSGKVCRVPRQGCFFQFTRIAGYVLTAFGLLVVAAGLIGSVIVGVRVTPTLLDSIRGLHSQMGAFVFVLSLMSLLVFPAVGLVGAVTAGIGCILSYVSTEPAEASGSGVDD